MASGVSYRDTQEAPLDVLLDVARIVRWRGDVARSLRHPPTVPAPEDWGVDLR